MHTLRFSTCSFDHKKSHFSTIKTEIIKIKATFNAELLWITGFRHLKSFIMSNSHNPICEITVGGVKSDAFISGV